MTNERYSQIQNLKTAAEIAKRAHNQAVAASNAEYPRATLGQVITTANYLTDDQVRTLIDLTVSFTQKNLTEAENAYAEA